MTPAIDLLKKQNISFSLHEYKHDPHCESFGEEAAQKLNLNASYVFKTLLITDDKEFFVAIIPVTGTLNLKRAAKAFSVKKLRMANSKEAERITGYLVGGISPIGQRKRLQTRLDNSAKALTSLYVSGGKRGLEIEITPYDLLNSCQTSAFADLKDS